MTHQQLVDRLNAYDTDNPGDSWRYLTPAQLAAYILEPA